MTDSLSAIREGAAWKEAYLALRAYYSNNNGANVTRRRNATDRLKEMGLLTKTGGVRANDRKP